VSESQLITESNQAPHCRGFFVREQTVLRDMCVSSAPPHQTSSNSKPVTRLLDYPALYITAGVSDPRVFHWQPAKWVANIRSFKTDDNIVLFKTNMQSGHFGKTGRYAKIDDKAQMYAFLNSSLACQEGQHYD